MSAAPPPPGQKPSQAPSWIMVGFVLGIVTMFGFRAERSPSPPAANLADATSALPDPATATTAPAPAEGKTLDGRPSLHVVQALFEQFREFAFWDNGRTEIAVWNVATDAFSEHFEVLRTETGTYFRPIAAFTWLPLEDYGPEHSPILFSETPRMRALRYQQAFGTRPKPPSAPEKLEFPTAPRQPGRD